MSTTTVSNTEISNELRTSTVRDFMISNKLAVHNEVRANANGYTYLTFINSDNVAENVYFAKTIADQYPVGTAIAKGFFEGLQIGFTTNASGEERTKIIPIGSGSRLSMDDLF